MSKKKAVEGALNVPNRTLFISDNLPVLEGINSRSVDLIYLDPPFNSNRDYSAPMGSEAAGQSFNDAWNLSKIDIAWIGQIAERHPALATLIDTAGVVNGDADKSYLVFMARRLLEMRRILKPDGSIYLHCDPTMSHSLKMVMDAIFGGDNFRNEIIWSYNRFSRRGDAFPSMHDIILFYGVSKKINFHKLTTEPRDTRRYEIGYHTVVDGGKKKLLVYDEEKAKERIAKAKEEGIPIVPTKARYPAMGSVWSDISIINPMADERTNWRTQKPLDLLLRIIDASCPEKGIVLDPFCGCATACIAAEIRERQWIGIDIDPTAEGVTKSRLLKEADKSQFLAQSPEANVKVSRTAPARTDEQDTTVNPKEYKHELYGMQNGKCAACQYDFPFRNLTIDHIIPRKAHGGDTKENLQLLCHACNSTKGGNRSMEELMERLREQGVIS